MVRPITVSNNYTNFRTNNYKPNFGHTQDMTDDRVDNIKKQGLNLGCFGGFMIGMALAAIGIGITDSKNTSDAKALEESRIEALNKFFELQKDKDIKKDTFTVKDVNHDQVPDIILYRKDGSQVVWDVNNNKVLDGINADRFFEAK